MQCIDASRKYLGFVSRFCKKTKTAEAMTGQVQCNLQSIFCIRDPIRFLTFLGHRFFDSLTLVAPSQARPCSAEAPLGPLPSPPSFLPPAITHPCTSRPPAQPRTPSLDQGCLGKPSARPAHWRFCRTWFPLRWVSWEKNSYILVRA